MAAVSCWCTSCNGVLHPLCGKPHSESSRLTCFRCYEQYEQTFASIDKAEFFKRDWRDDGRESPKKCAEDDDASTVLAKQSEHDRLVSETKKKMMPDECPKLHLRAQG
jgi:hypothetical protein